MKLAVRILPGILTFLFTASGTLSAATVEGRVTNAAELPVGGVDVGLYLNAGTADPHTEPFRSGRTGPEGHFRFEGPEPRAYSIVARKNGWEDAEEGFAITSDASSPVTNVNITMRLTLLNRIIARFHLGTVLYIILFGLLVLAFNFLVPEPSNGVRVAGWLIMLVGCGIAWVKFEWMAATVIHGDWSGCRHEHPKNRTSVRAATHGAGAGRRTCSGTRRRANAK